jgi:murein L,D-transpeptidase YafK
MPFRKIFIAALALVFIGLVVYNFYPAGKIPDGISIDKLVVNKAKRQLIAYANGRIVATYTVALGKCPTGKKQVEGDHKTPEGSYTIYAKNPNSAYHKNLGISYPNADDIAAAKQVSQPTGEDIKIHGMNNTRPFLGRLHKIVDWTNGCIALTNEEMDALYAHTPVGTPIIINP